jgi:hypothetical protein
MAQDQPDVRPKNDSNDYPSDDNLLTTDVGEEDIDDYQMIVNLVPDDDGWATNDYDDGEADMEKKPSPASAPLQPFQPLDTKYPACEEDYSPNR